MLGLKLPTDPRWADVASKNLDEILSDHAWCEQKAASTAISLIVNYPEYPDLTNEMTLLAMEEMSHFKLVHDLIIKRGLTLDYHRKDEYVNQLLKFFPKGGSRETQLIHRLLYAALIEARSCERFKLFSEKLEDPELKTFYHKLMVSEAGHYTLFINFARKFGNPEEVNKKWQDLLEFEAEIMRSFSDGKAVHG